eukprot:2833655-Prymnesium_polylepis.1
MHTALGAKARRAQLGCRALVARDGRRQHRSIETRRVGDALTLPTLRPSMNSTVRLLGLVARR